jgi:predicted cobalt transporter CbtA
MNLLSYVRRGAIAGTTGGALAGIFGLALAEPLMDRAVRLESARAAAEDAAHQAAGQLVEHHAEVFSRGTQHLGLLVASVVTGAALGVLFGVLYAVAHRTDPAPGTGRDGWHRALVIGAAAWFAVFLVPYVRYPANPPGVGDPDTLDTRTRSYLAAIAVGILGVLAAVRLAQDLRARGTAPSHRQLAVTAVLLATLALPFVLPADTDPLDVPAGLLWQFRLLALATSTLLWGGLTVTFGLLTERAEQPRQVGRSSPARSALSQLP